MRCPKCNQAMTQVGKFWVCPEHGSVQVEETKSQELISTLPEEHPLTSLVNELPFPLALALSEYVREDNPFVKLHRLADAAELLTRFVTMILLSDVLRQRGEFPESLRNALVDKIERPTFGAWRVLLYEANNHLPKKKGKVKCFLTQLPVYVNKHLLPSLGSGEGDHTKHIIALRNLLAHAGRLPDERAQDLLEHHKKTFEALMEKLSFITDYTPITCTDEGRVLSLRGLPQSDGSFPEYDASQLSQSPQKGRVLLIHESEVLNLFPLHAFIEVLQWREEEIVHIAEPVPQLYFRMNNKGYLEFTTLSDHAAFSQQRGEALERFREIFRLEEWRRLTEDEQQLQEFSFDKLVKEMTEVFVGREENVHKVKACLKAKESGVLFISGEPGVGKTALMAKIVKDYRGAPHYVTIPYFFRTGHTTCSTDQFLKAALLRLHTELNEPLEISTTLEERRKQLVEAVQTASNQLDKKILFMVDGMDEIHRIDSSFISLPFTINASNVVWLCAGRSEKALEESLRHNGAEWVFPNGLAKLDEQGIRAMLTAHLDRLKYQLFARDEVELDESGKEEYRNRFIEVLVSKSEGLPLYVQMIIEDLREGKWTLEDEDKLPDGLIDYFDQILERLRVSDVGTVLTPLFCLLAWTKEPVTESALKLLLSDHHLSQTEGWEELFRKALSHGHLMLRSAQTPEGEAGWTFYHETFRQHLMTTQAVSSNREWAQATWLRWCDQWQTLEEESLHSSRWATRKTSNVCSSLVPTIWMLRTVCADCWHDCILSKHRQ